MVAAKAGSHEPIIFYTTSDSCGFSGCISVWPKETSNFAVSLWALIILLSCDASPFPKDRSKQSSMPKAVQTLWSGVFQETFHSRCPTPPQSDARTAAARSSGVQQPQDTAKIPNSARPRTGSSWHVPAVFRVPQHQAGYTTVKSLLSSCFISPSSCSDPAKFPHSVPTPPPALEFSWMLVVTVTLHTEVTPHPFSNTSLLMQHKQNGLACPRLFL